MNIIEAVALLKQGKKVRPVNPKNEDLDYIVIEEGNGKGVITKYFFPGDIQREWELVEEEASPITEDNQ